MKKWFYAFIATWIIGDLATTYVGIAYFGLIEKSPLVLQFSENLFLAMIILKLIFAFVVTMQYVYVPYKKAKLAMLQCFTLMGLLAIGNNSVVILQRLQF